MRFWSLLLKGEYYFNNTKLIKIRASGPTFFGDSAKSVGERMQKVAVVGGNTVSYAYDHTGDRTSITDAGTTTIFPSQYQENTGANLKKYIYLGSTLLATVENNGGTITPHYAHADHLGGSSVMTSGAGAVDETIDYYPYGETRLDNKAGAFDERHKYTGYEFDATTGLNYAQARYQTPLYGRFISQDPAFWQIKKEAMIDPQFWNSYAYARNNPLLLKDPNGEFPVVFATIAIVALSGSMSVGAKTAYAPTNDWVSHVNYTRENGTTMSVKYDPSYYDIYNKEFTDAYAFTESLGIERNNPNKNITSLDGLQQNTILGIADTQSNCDCDLQITGGTETFTHSPAPGGHHFGYKVDYRNSPGIVSFVQSLTNGQSISAYTEYSDALGNQYMYETNPPHVDVEYGQNYTYDSVEFDFTKADQDSKKRKK